jgi:hypothetical protein
MTEQEVDVGYLSADVELSRCSLHPISSVCFVNCPKGCVACSCSRCETKAFHTWHVSIQSVLHLELQKIGEIGDAFNISLLSERVQWTAQLPWAISTLWEFDVTMDIREDFASQCRLSGSVQGVDTGEIGDVQDTS